MKTLSTVRILTDFMLHMREHGTPSAGPFTGWYVGLTTQMHTSLAGHNVLWRKARSSDEAIEVFDEMINVLRLQTHTDSNEGQYMYIVQEEMPIKVSLFSKRAEWC